MSKNIILIGAGGLGKEVFGWFENDICDNTSIKGFLDKTDPNLSKFGIKSAYLGNECDYVFENNDYAIITISDIDIRNKIYSNLVNKVKFTNLIHSKAIISNNVNLGIGNIISPNCIISNNVSIGNNNLININSSICHESTIKDNVVISPHSLISGQCFIDNGVFIGSNATIVQKSKIGSKTIIEANTLVKGEIQSNTYICGVPGRVFPKKQ